MPLTTNQRGAWARCHSFRTIARPSSHPNRNVPATNAGNGKLLRTDESPTRASTSRAWRAGRVDARAPAWHKMTMSMRDSVKDAVLGRAMRLMSDPRLSRVMGDPRVMNVAMKAVGLGGTIKAELDRASRFAAGLFGLATQEEVSALRSTVQTLEDNLSSRDAKPGGSAV